MHKYKPGDKVIVLDYNGKPQVPYVVAKIEDIVGPDRVRLFLPDHACCLEFLYRLQPIDEDTYEQCLKSTIRREKPLPSDLRMNITAFAAEHPGRKDDIYSNFEFDKHYISVIHAYSGKVQMFGEDFISEDVEFEYQYAVQGLKKTRKFFHELDESIPLIQEQDI